MEEVPEEEGAVYVEEFSKLAEAGKAGGCGKSFFSERRDEEIQRGADPLGPFANEDEWELARWLVKNVGHTQSDMFLKLPIVSIFTMIYQ
jgi:hypothetical protein